MISTHNNVCRYFTIAVTTPKPFSMPKHIHYSPYSGRARGVPQTVRMVLRIGRTVRGNMEMSSVVPLIIAATNQYHTCQIHCIQNKKWIKICTHYPHFPWPDDFWAICLHHFLSWALKGALDGALEGALNEAL